MKKSVFFRTCFVLLIVLSLAMCSIAFFACGESSGGTSAGEKKTGDAADGKFVFTANKNANKVDVTVKLSKNPGYNLLFLTLDYDDTVLTFTGYDQGTALSSLGMTPTNPNTEKGYSITPFNFIYGGITKNDTSTGTLLTLHFTVKSAAKKGTTFVGFTYDKNKGITQFKSDSDVAMTPEIVYASVTID